MTLRTKMAGSLLFVQDGLAFRIVTNVNDGHRMRRAFERLVNQLP